MAATLAAECSSRFTDSEHYNKYKVLHWVCYQSKHTVVVCEEVCVRVAVGGVHRCGYQRFVTYMALEEFQ